MIKVLQVVDKLSVGESTIHGVTRLFSWWIPRFDKSRFDVSLCSLRKRDKAGEFLEKLGIKIFYLNKSKFDPSTLTSLISLIKREHIDILHLHGYGASTFGRIAGSLYSVPSIIHEHMIDRTIPFYQKIADRMLSGKTACGIAVSDEVKMFMVKKRGLKQNQVAVNENGVPLESFSFDIDKDHSKKNSKNWIENLKIPSNHQIVGSIGRLSLVKGHIYLLRAAKMTLEHCPQVTFLIVGDGELRSSLENMAQQLGIAGNVKFTGHCEDVAPLLSIMEIVVISSFTEGGPITLFEAMASGCAVISTNTIGLKSKIKNNVNGFLIPPKNAKAIAELIIKLVNDSELREKISNEALKSSREFDINLTVNTIEACYENILNQ